MSECSLKSALAGMVPSTTGERQAREAVRFTENWTNDADAATTTAIAERPICAVKCKCRLVGLKFSPASAVTGAATNYFTLQANKRAAAAPSTQKPLYSYNADTAGTDDIAQYASKDLTQYKDNSIAPVEADYDFAEGDVLTINVAKAASGMTFPIGTVTAIFEMRD